jgi:sugar diacid utilization regulator/GAF domain-containing protein
VGANGFGVTSSRDLLRAFTSISRALNLGQPLSDTLDLIAEKVSLTMGHKYCAVLLANKETGELLIEGSFGLGEEYVRALNKDLKQMTEGTGPRARSVTAQAYRTRMPAYAPDVTVDPRFAAWREAALRAGYRSIVALPLVFRDEAIGVLNCYDEPREYTEDEVEALMVVAEQAASAVGIARLMEEQRSTIEELNALNRRVVAQHALLRRSEEAHEALTALLLEDRSLDDLTSTLSELLGASVVLQDERLNVLSRSPDRDVRYGGIVADDVHRRAESLLEKLGTSGQVGSAKLEWGGPPRSTLLVAPVDLGGRGVGLLSAQLEEGLDEGFLLRTLEQASPIYALHMMRRRAEREAEERIKGDLLAELLSGRYGSEAEARERARAVGLDFAQRDAPPRMIVVRHEPLSEYLAGQGRSTGASEHVRGRLLALARGLATEDGRGAVGADGDHLVALLPQREGEGRRLAGRLCKLVLDELPGLRFRVGVSSPARAPGELADRYRETKGLLELAENLNAAEHVVCHDDWGVYHLLLSGHERDSLLTLAHSTLDPIITQGDGRGELLATLHAYLENGLSPSRTAKALYVHPNTVKYRLKRISALPNLDLESLDGILTAKLALMVRSLDEEGFDADARTNVFAK